MPARGGPVRRQFLGILVSRGLGSALQALALIVLARSVAPTEFGAVNVVIAVVGFALVGTGLGMSVYVPWARASGRDDEVVAALRVNTGSNYLSAVVGVTVVSVWAHLGGLPWGVALIALSLALERNADTWLGVPIADGRSAVAVVSVLLRRVVCLVVMLPAIALGLDPVLAYTAGLVAGSLAGQLHVRLAVSDLCGTLHAVPASVVIRAAWPFLVSNATGQARTLDVGIVGLVLGSGGAGVYAAATKLVQPLLLVPQSLAAVLVPHSTKVDGRSARKLGVRLGAGFAACLLLALPLGLGGEQIVVLLMGEQYAGAGAVFSWALVAVPFIAWASSLGAILQGQSQERLVAGVGAVFALIMVGAIALGAMLAGPAGGAAGLAASYLLRSVVLALALLSPGRVPPERDGD